MQLVIQEILISQTSCADVTLGKSGKEKSNVLVYEKNDVIPWYV